MVRFSTFALNHLGDVGVRVGGEFYARTGGAEKGVATMQVLVLDRDNLQERDNRRFDLTGNWQGPLEEFLKQLGNTDLVIVAVQPSDRAQPIKVDTNPLARIGAKLFDGSANPNVWYSAIGVPGMQLGDADEKDVRPDAYKADRSGLDGYLSPDQHDNYGYIPSTHVNLRLDSEHACPPAASLCRYGTGYVVRVLDAHSGDPLPGREHFFETNAGGRDSEFYDTLAARDMVRALEGVKDDEVVTIQSFSTQVGPDRYLPAISGLVPRVWTAQLANQVARLGGTWDAFNRTARMDPGPDSHGVAYSLVGWGGAHQANGAERAAQRTGQQQEAELALTLRPNHASLLRPADVTDGVADVNVLSDLMLDRDSEKWPLSDDPGAMKAFSYLGQHSGSKKLGADPRAAYWSQNLDPTTLDSIRGDVEKTTYPDGNGEFTKTQFDTARAELARELRYVANVRTYLNLLSTPYGAGLAIDSWAKVHRIADQVQQSVRAPDDWTTASWRDLIRLLLETTKPATGHASSAVGALFDLAVWAFGATEDGAPTADQFRVKANQLGEELADRAVGAERTYHLVGDAIVSDWHSLRLIGEYGGCNPQGATPEECPSKYAFDEHDRVKASDAIRRAVESLIYEKLVPLAYTTFDLKATHGSHPPTDVAAQFYCPFPGHIFHDFPKQSWVALERVIDPVNDDNEYQTYILSRPNPGSTDRDALTTITKKMFDSVTDGGLGISPERFLVAQPHREVDAVGCHWVS